jgi:AcrR family transcriptional regulator
MARPRNADSQRTRQAILDASLDLFSERGFFGTSLRDIARAVGVRESALYHYFASKDALFEALIAADQDTRRERLAAVLDEPVDDPRAALERFTRLSLEHFATPGQQQLFRILMSDGLRLARDGRLNLVDRLNSSRAGMCALMQRLIDRGWLRDADPDLLALQFVSPLLHWRQLLALDPGLVPSPAEFARAHVDHFLRGAAERPERTSAAARPPRPRRQPAAGRHATARPRV